MFNLQLFGNNDTVTSSSELKYNLGFTDGDTRILNLKNPKSGLTDSDVNAVKSFFIASDTSLIVGDKNGSDFAGFISIEKIDKTTRTLDLS